MKRKEILLAAAALSFACCTPQPKQDPLPSWNQTPVKARLLNFIEKDVNQIPVEDRIAVFDMDGTLIGEKPLCAEWMVSVQRLLALGKTDPAIRESAEYVCAKKLSVNPRDTSVWNHRSQIGNLIMKAFDGADSEEYVQFAHDCLLQATNADYGIKYVDMFYQPMLELVELLKQKHFQVYVVSASMQGIVWSICPENIGVERTNLIGIRHHKKVSFSPDGKLTYTLRDSSVQPVNGYHGKAINIYDHIGKIPVMAVGNSYSDFGMFHMASCSKYPNLSMMLNHDDAAREYDYHNVRGTHLEDSLRLNNWVQVDISKEFNVVWRKK